MFDLIIIGSGPAGIAAAIYALRSRLDLLVLEREPFSGGQMLSTYEIGNYPGFPTVSGFELSQKLRQHAEEMGAVFAEEEVIAVRDEGSYKKIVTNEKEYHAKAVIWAAGAYHRRLGVPGENELFGTGVSCCATCDGAFFRGKTVGVVGAGNTALEDALFLSRNCSEVYLIVRSEILRGDKRLQEKVLSVSNIHLLYDTTVECLEGEGHLQAAVLYNRKKKEFVTLELQGLFIAIGLIPNTEILQNVIKLDSCGYALAGEDGRTDVPGIFVAGDARSKHLRQIVTAVADGANCVASVELYLNCQL